MKRVWVAFECDEGIGPWLIRKFTKFGFNHVLFIYESEDWKTKWVAESVRNAGVRAVPLLPHRNPKNIFSVKYDIAKDIIENQEMITRHYSTITLLVIGICIFFANLFRTVIRYPKLDPDPKGEDCSEYLARILQRKFPEEMKDPQWKNPKHLDTFMREHPEHFDFCGDVF